MSLSKMNRLVTEIQESKDIIMALTKKKEQEQQNHVPILSTYLYLFLPLSFLTL
jgi:hypothetical protein